MLITPSMNKVASTTTSNQYFYPRILFNKIHVSDINNDNKENYQRNDIFEPQQLMQTPILNKKTEKFDSTFILDS